MADNTLTLKLDKETILPLFEGLRGPKGEKGEDGQRGERGEQGEQGLRGPKGEDGSAEKTAQFLKEHNIWLEDESVDTVLMKVVELSNCYNNFVPRPLEYIQPIQGQTFLDLKGEPHFKVAINGGAKQAFVTDNMRVQIPAFGEDDINCTYYDLADREIGVISIKGVESTAVEETYTDATGAKFAKIGRKLVLQLSDYKGGSFNWLGKWTKQAIEVIEIKTNKNVTLVDTQSKTAAYDGLTFVIKEPQKVSFDVNSNYLGNVTITTLDRSVRIRLEYSLEWNGATYEQGL